MTDVSRFKVVYEGNVLNAVALVSACISEGSNWQCRNCVENPETIELLVINEYGNLVSIMDEARKFQFIPIMDTNKIRILETMGGCD